MDNSRNAYFFLQNLRDVIMDTHESRVNLDSYCSKHLVKGVMVPNYDENGMLIHAHPSVLFAKNKISSQYGLDSYILKSFDGSFNEYPVLLKDRSKGPDNINSDKFLSMPFPQDFDNFMEDSEAYRKLFSMFKRGKWDHHLMPKGTVMSHKQLTIARIDRYLEAMVDKPDPQHL